MKRLALFFCVVLLGALVAPTASSAQSDEPEWFVDEESLPFEALEGFEDTKRLWGVFAGAGYRIEVPDHWNGDLIMWTHGFRGEDARLFFNPPEEEFNEGFREWMLEQGYAWAASTYRKNGYNVTTGVLDTRLLTSFFKYKVDRPDDVYIAGYSMGGHIAAVSAEYFGRTYSGAMPLCGAVGDYELFDYFLDYNVAGPQLGLGASQFPVDADYLFDEVPRMKKEFGMEVPFQFDLTKKGEQFKQLVELRSGGDRPNFDQGFEFWNSIPSVSGGGNFLWELGLGDGTIAGRPGVVIDNTDVVYQVDLDPEISDVEAKLNRSIARVEQDEGARSRFLWPNPPPVTGRLKMPVLTIHNLGDLFVPFHNEIRYAEDTAAKGKSHLLVQRAVRGVGHCDFSDEEMIAGMKDLIHWAENGVRPKGDVILDPAAVADPDYGCNFTKGVRTLPAVPCS